MNCRMMIYTIRDMNDDVNDYSVSTYCTRLTVNTDLEDDEAI